MNPTLLTNGRYNNDTETIEFDAIKMEQIGIYTVRDRQTQKLFYTYKLKLVNVENNVPYILAVVVPIATLVAFMFVVYVLYKIFLSKAENHGSSNCKYQKLPLFLRTVRWLTGNGQSGGQEP